MLDMRPRSPRFDGLETVRGVRGNTVEEVVYCDGTKYSGGFIVSNVSCLPRCERERGTDDPLCMSLQVRWRVVCHTGRAPWCGIRRKGLELGRGLTPGGSSRAGCKGRVNNKTSCPSEKCSVIIMYCGVKRWLRIGNHCKANENDLPVGDMISQGSSSDSTPK